MKELFCILYMLVGIFVLIISLSYKRFKDYGREDIFRKLSFVGNVAMVVFSIIFLIILKV